MATSSGPDAVDRAADELYALDPDEFTAARNARARELAKGGDKDAAAAVKALPKPTVPAWALNQAARRHPGTIDALLEAGTALRQAQEQALGGDASGLRSATREEKARIADAVAAASAVLRETGKEPTAAQVERMTATLRAAATDGGAGQLLRTGRLVTDLSPAGFGLDDLTLAPPPRRSATKPPTSAKATEQTPKTPKQDEVVDGLRQEAREAARAADQAERAAATAEEEAAEADEQAQAAAQRARHLAHEARAARSAAAKARREAEAAASRLRRASG